MKTLILVQEGSIIREIAEIINERMPEFPIVKALELAIEINNRVIKPNLMVEPLKPGEPDARD